MLQSPRIPEITLRDRFIKQVAAQRVVYAVAGEEGLGRVGSQRQRGRDVTLFWTSRKSAERWADVVASAPLIREIPLDELLGEVLPAISRLDRLAGPDWGSDPVEPEVAASDLAERLKREIVEGFAERVKATGKVYVLEDSSGPALLVSQFRSDRLVLPCWSERAFAERRIEGPWADMLAVELPLASFTAKTLGWLDERGWLAAPDHVVGAGIAEFEPQALLSRFRNAAL